MARQASSKPADSTAAVVASSGIRLSGFVISSLRVQHFIHLLAPHGMAGFVLANGSMSSIQSGDCPARSATLVNKWREKSESMSVQGVSALDLLYEDYPETK
jgi:hypothetical protein